MTDMYEAASEIRDIIAQTRNAIGSQGDCIATAIEDQTKQLDKLTEAVRDLVHAIRNLPEAWIKSHE